MSFFSVILSASVVWFQDGLRELQVGMETLAQPGFLRPKNQYQPGLLLRGIPRIGAVDHFDQMFLMPPNPGQGATWDQSQAEAQPH